MTSKSLSGSLRSSSFHDRCRQCTQWEWQGNELALYEYRGGDLSQVWGLQSGMENIANFESTVSSVYYNTVHMKCVNRCTLDGFRQAPLRTFISALLLLSGSCWFVMWLVPLNCSAGTLTNRMIKELTVHLCTRKSMHHYLRDLPTHKQQLPSPGTDRTHWAHRRKYRSGWSSAKIFSVDLRCFYGLALSSALSHMQLTHFPWSTRRRTMFVFHSLVPSLLAFTRCFF